MPLGDLPVLQCSKPAGCKRSKWNACQALFWLVHTRVFHPGFGAWFGHIRFDSLLNVFLTRDCSSFHPIVLCILMGCLLYRPICSTKWCCEQACHCPAASRPTFGWSCRNTSVIWSFAVVLRLFQLSTSIFADWTLGFPGVLVAMTCVLKG